MAKEYKVEAVTEGGCGSIFLGASVLPTKKMESVMNEYAAKGYKMEFIVLESRRMLLFWTREAAVITFSREKQD
jgi:hypothetical protein